VLTHPQLLKQVWGPAYTDAAHYIRVYMAKLRRKLERDPVRPRYLLTEPGVGYCLAAEKRTEEFGPNERILVEMTTGTILSDAGAGNIAYQVPTVISATQTNGAMQRFYGCYLLHRVNVPIGDTIPPYPIALRAAHIIAAPASADPAALLEQANALVQGGQCTQ